MKILALIAVALTAGGMWGFAQQPLVQTAQTYWRACPWWNGSRAAYGNYDPTTGTWYYSRTDAFITTTTMAVVTSRVHWVLAGAA